MRWLEAMLWGCLGGVMVSLSFASACGGDGAASGGANTGGGAGHRMTGTSEVTTGSAGGAGAGGATTASIGAGAGGTGGIDPGAFDCRAPVGEVPALKLTPVVVAGVGQPVDLKFAPGDPARMFVVDLNGKITIVKDGVVGNTFLDVSALVLPGAEEGLLGLAFHPRYQQNGRFFVYYSAAGTAAMILAEYRRDGSDPDKANPQAVQILLSQDTLQENHNGGALQFSPADGFLYLGWGDGGGDGDDTGEGHGACGNGQNKDVLLGKVLRLDVDQRASGKPYRPAGVVPGGAPEVWDYGFRNPWRFSFDGCTGDLFIGDVGNVTHEEIDFEPAGMGGKNYGWRCWEGNGQPEQALNEQNGCPCDPMSQFTFPVMSFDRTQAGTIIGGYFYRGNAIPGLRRHYVFGNFAPGASTIWAVDPKKTVAPADAGLPRDWAFDTIGSDPFGGNVPITLTGFGQDLDGEIYALDINGGVFKIEAQN